MLFDAPAAEPCVGDDLIRRFADPRWGVDSEYGRLLDVAVAAPSHLEVVPCNAVSQESLAAGLTCSTIEASRQHAALLRTVERCGVTCHVVPATPGMADLCFTRDSTLMTPWGLVVLRAYEPHRRAEAEHVRRALGQDGVPFLARIEEGCVEGGDVLIIRPGLVAIGVSGRRTDAAGARALARIFEARGWRVLTVPFDPHFLHLDTLFTMVDARRAVACVEELPAEFLAEMAGAGISLIHASQQEVKRLGANLVSLGAGRILSGADNGRINGELERLGYLVLQVEIDQFTRCGGGVHCLTMPLARLPG